MTTIPLCECGSRDVVRMPCWDDEVVIYECQDCGTIFEADNFVPHKSKGGKAVRKMRRTDD